MTPCRTSILSPTTCALYHPGHKTHPIQAKKARGNEAHWIDALARFYDDGVIGLRLWGSGELIRVWHHTPRRGSMTDGSPAQLNKELHLMRIQTHLVSIAQAEL